MVERQGVPWRRELDYLLQILGVTGFAVVQPVLDVMGKSPETFIFRQTVPLQIVAFALLVATVPAVALWGVSAAAAAFGPRARRGAHLAVLGVLVSVIGIQVLKRISPLPSAGVLVSGLLVGGLVAWLSTRAPALGTWTRWAAIVPVVSVGVFLLGSPASKLLRAAEAGTAARDAASVTVVMVVLDEFPLGSLLDSSGEINANLYPNIAELGARSTWYRNYTVTEAGTRFSVPSILTGRHEKDRTKEPLALDYPNNLFTMLSATHRLEVFEPYTALCPARLCAEAGSAGHGGDFSAVLRDAAVVWSELSLPGESARDITAQFDEPEHELADLPDPATVGLGDPGPFERFLRSFAPGDPAVHYIHLMLPHVPWKRFRDGREYDVTGAGANLAFAERGGRQLWVDEVWPLRLARQRHLLQVQYVDGLIGQLIDRLEEVGMLDETLLVITSDHGGSIQPGRLRRSPNRDNAHEIFWVPLFIKGPGQTEGEVDDRNLMAVDLLPTIAGFLDTAVPWPVDGASALEPGTGQGTVKTFTVDRGDAESTVRIDQAAAQRRMRVEAFEPPTGCRADLCPHLVGPGKSMLGEQLDAFTIGPASERSAALTLPTELFVAEERPLPALIIGNLVEASPDDDTKVVVSVNGVIAGVSETWSRGGTNGLFGVLSPQSLLRSGENDVRLFELQGSILHPITLRL